MKRVVLLLFVFMLMSCSKSKESSLLSESSIREYDYADVEDRFIEWERILSLDNQYYVYIYSSRCGHCNDIKQDVLRYALTHESFYFVSFTKDIPIIQDESTNIGVDSYERLGIVGTPTLFEIHNHIVTNCFTGSTAIIETLTKS